MNMKAQYKIVSLSEKAAFKWNMFNMEYDFNMLNSLSLGVCGKVKSGRDQSVLLIL